jgi:replication initiation protein RepC
MGSITQQPVFRPILRREIMAAVNTCSRDLGLRQGSVVVLDALLSCLPCQGQDGREAPVTPATLLTVYASNDTLCFRAKGLTDRQLRRHIDTLERAGLLLRRDSANGKRFPVMKDGKPVGAFGLDLSPLFARADDLLALAQRRREEADELRGLRAQILRLRAACLQMRLDDDLASFLDGLRNLVRRTSLTLIEARAALSRLTTVTETDDPVAADAASGHDLARTEPADSPMVTVQIAAAPARNTNKTTACDGRSVRHIEPESKTKKESATSDDRWSDLTEVSAFYSEPQSARETTAIAFEFGRMLKISQDLLARAAARLGIWQLLKLEDRMARNAETIQNPDAYLRAILTA